MASQPPTTAPPAAALDPSPLPTHDRYVLRLIAFGWIVGGWIIAILGGGAVVVGSVHTGYRRGVPQAVLYLIEGSIVVEVTALFLLAGAAIIRLAIAVEANTRLTAEAVTRRAVP
jgi:hypothetical protein